MAAQITTIEPSPGFAVGPLLVSPDGTKEVHATIPAGEDCYQAFRAAPTVIRLACGSRLAKSCFDSDRRVLVYLDSPWLFSRYAEILA